jgi:hypothetical protein
MAESQKRVKHVPERTCVACRQKRAKWELVRIVRTPQGCVEIDIKGKKSGRGAYLCMLQRCWEMALKGKRLERVLKTEIVSEQRAGLDAYGKTLPGVVGQT